VRNTGRQPSDPNELPAQADVDDVLSRTDWNDFVDALENIHDGIHGWVGGDMGIVASAAFDPIFWSHHCMIDRIWYLWQLRNGVNNIPQEYLALTLGPFNLSVADVLNIGHLGYEYAVADVSVAVSVGN